MLSRWSTETGQGQATIDTNGSTVVMVDGFDDKVGAKLMKKARKAKTSEPLDEREMWGPDAGDVPQLPELL